MDQDRQIRLLIPPFFFLATLTLISQLSGTDLIALAKTYTTEQLLAIGAVLGAATLPGGYLLTSITLLALHGFARLKGWPTHETHVSDTSFQRVWKRVGRSGAAKRADELFAVATFDHEILEAGIHTWVMRRWNAFNVAVSSLIGILIATLVALTFAWPSCLALLILFAACTVLGANGWRAWHQTMHMLEFQAARKTRKAASVEGPG